MPPGSGAHRGTGAGPSLASSCAATARWPSRPELALLPVSLLSPGLSAPPCPPPSTPALLLRVKNSTRPHLRGRAGRVREKRPSSVCGVAAACGPGGIHTQDVVPIGFVLGLNFSFIMILFVRIVGNEALGGVCWQSQLGVARASDGAPSWTLAARGRQKRAGTKPRPEHWCARPAATAAPPPAAGRGQPRGRAAGSRGSG